MTTGKEPSRRPTEARLESLKEEARRTGRVADAGVAIAGGPIPRDSGVPRHSTYYGQPIVKPPVWTWQVGLYFFVGGTAGMSAVLAFAGLLMGQSSDFVRSALGIALAGALISPCLLIWDLGRPSRFINMLRVFKWRSAMSMGVWTLVVFSGFSGSSFAVAAGFRVLAGNGLPDLAVRVALFMLVSGAAVSGAVLATYTGVLLGATVVPAWSDHYRLLPFHFGIVALGSAAAVLELLGFRLPALNAIGLAVTAVETGVGGWIELNRRGVTARALHEGLPGLLLRAAGVLTGPLAFVLRMLGAVPLAALSLLIGALCSRYGWVLAGRVSAMDPQEILASQAAPDA